MGLTLEHLTKGIQDFDRWTHSDKIKLFCWYLPTYQGRTGLKPADVAKCYDELHSAAPTSVGPFLQAMTKRKPPEATYKSGVYKLEKRLRDDFDKKYGQSPNAIIVDTMLNELPNRLPSIDQKGYPEEALTCLRHCCFRAAVIMAWNLAYDHLCELILAKHLPDFNAQLPRSFAKADIQVINKRDDFEHLKESQVLQVCKSANIISPNLHKVAKEKLDRRNLAAHPSNQVPLQSTAEEFIRDLTENFLLQL